MQPRPCPLPGRPWEGCGRCSPSEDAAPLPSALLPASLLGLSSSFPSSPVCSPLAKASWEPAKVDFLPRAASPLDAFAAPLALKQPLPAACPDAAAGAVPAVGMGQVACPTLPGPKGFAPRGPWRISLKSGRGLPGISRRDADPWAQVPAAEGKVSMCQRPNVFSP